MCNAFIFTTREFLPTGFCHPSSSRSDMCLIVSSRRFAELQRAFV